MAPERSSSGHLKNSQWFSSLTAQEKTATDLNFNYKLSSAFPPKPNSDNAVGGGGGGGEEKHHRRLRNAIGNLLAFYQSRRTFIAFLILWAIISFVSLIFNIWNMMWDKTSYSLGFLFVVTATLLHANVFESVLIAATTILIGGHKRPIKTAPYHHLSLLINYNILAIFQEDIDETIETMYQAYMGNLSFKTSCVLVSATSNSALKQYELAARDKYRKLIYQTLHTEGLNFVQQKYHLVSNTRYIHVWRQHQYIQPNIFINHYLPEICQHFSDQFMLVHRISRVLKKCGQYQDLMLLSHGDNQAFSYTDQKLYGKLARPFGEPLFYPSPDVDRIYGRCFDYTLVLDGDTVVPEGHCYELLSIAAAYPEQGIIQPGIKIVTHPDDTIFMRIECLRQHLCASNANAMAELLGQVSFFGKGLIKNDTYIKSVIGTREKPLELIPIDALSHDTYEAACLKPLHAGAVYLVEAPCRNYITWNIRETRWNTGDLILAVHFWPQTLGKIVRNLQKVFQGKNYNPINVREKPYFDMVTSYISHSAIRHMSTKILLFVYLLLRTMITLRNPHFPDLNATFFILLFPKFAAYNGGNLKLILIEAFISFLQFTPDIFAGVLRVFVALRSILQSTPRWIPQRAIEEQFQKSNNFLLSFRELWLVSICALILCFMTFTQSYRINVSLLISADYFVFILTALFLPFYCGLTSAKVGPKMERLLT